MQTRPRLRQEPARGPDEDVFGHEAPDESKLDLCYEAVMSEGCFQINVNKDPFYALYCCAK